MKILKKILMFCELDNREMSYQRTLLATNLLTLNSRRTSIHNLLCYINNIYRNILLCIMQYTCKHHLIDPWSNMAFLAANLMCSSVPVLLLLKMNLIIW